MAAAPPVSPWLLPATKPGCLGAHDLADGTTDHWLAEFGGLGVRGPGSHAAARVRVERKVDRAGQELAHCRFRDRSFDQFEVTFIRLTGRTVHEQDLSINDCPP